MRNGQLLVCSLSCRLDPIYEWWAQNWGQADLF